MKPIRSVLVALILCIVATKNYAQAIPQPNTGTVTAKDFALPVSHVINENTSAVVVFDVGSIHFVGDKDGRWVSYVYTRHRRVKIISKKQFDLATIRIFLFGRNERQDLLEDIKATTYTLEDGKVVASKLNANDLLEDRLGKNLVEKKFTFPGLKEGAIIDYSYKITSHRYYALPDWNFQEFGVPCLYSEFEIDTPDLLRYIIAHHGADSITSATNSEGFETLNVGGTTEGSIKVNSVIHKNKWVMTNVPGFSEVGFLHAHQDYLDKLEFHLIQTYNGEEVRGITNWESATKALIANQEFGLPIDVERIDNLSATVDKISGNDQSQIDAAKHIYAYIRDNFTCQPDNDLYIEKNLYDVNKQKRGNVADINMLLIAMLRRRNMDATPVILSTREYGIHPVVYPVLGKMNYVICRLRLGGILYFLDATNPHLAFGKLALNCYNGHGRVISNTDGADLYFNADSIKESSVTSVFIQNDEKGKAAMTANVEYSPGYFESTAIREAISKYGKDDYLKKIKSGFYSEMEMSNAGLDSLTTLELPVKVHYDVAVKSLDGADIIYFNPIISDGYKSNPFPAEERSFPVEMDYPLDRTYVLNMEIPAGYVIDEMPKSAKVAFDENEGFYEYLIQKDEANIQLRCRLKLNRATYAADEYNALRDFFAFVVKKESEQIVFKKKK